MREFKRIAIINKDNGLGDFVMSMPTLKSIKQGIPDSEIIFIASKNFKDIKSLFWDGPVDYFIENDITGYIGALKLMWNLRKHKVDLLINMPGCKRGVIVKPFTPTLVPHPDYCKANLAARLSEYHLKEQKKYYVDQHLQYAEWLGVKPIVNFDFNIHPEAIQEAERIIKKNELEGKVIALLLETNHPYKDIPKGLLRDIADSLVYDFNAKVLAVGYNNGNVLQENKNIVYLGKDVSLPAKNQILRYSGVPILTIGGDTGLAHVVGSVNQDGSREGNYTLILFGPSNPETYRPYDPSGHYCLAITPRGVNHKRLLKDKSEFGMLEKRNIMYRFKVGQVLEGIEMQLNKIQ